MCVKGELSGYSSAVFKCIHKKEYLVMLAPESLMVEELTHTHLCCW